MQNILVVCTGNICRSPLGEANLRALLPNRQLGSAGVGALVGHAPPEEAIEVARAAELDITGHRARQVSAQMIAEHDLVLVMEEGHLRWLSQNIPISVGRTYLYSHWGDRQDIPDPYRRNKAAYELAFEQIQHHSKLWAKRLG